MDVPTYTVEEYVALEEYSNIKHEYIDGQIRAMSGGTLEHSRLAAAVIVTLGVQLTGRACDVYTADARVRVVAGNLITYPDVSICCAVPETDNEDRNAMLNPTVIVEITSPSSEKYDRGTKFARYKLVPTLREYVVISHRERAVDVFRRLDDGSWSEADRAGAGERAKLLSIGCEIDVDGLYRRSR
jgi:Uma2 family endonuclease